MTVKGIDVASYQSSTFSTAGLGFVMVKATEGTGYVNPRHAAQVAHARAQGLVVGHYHFARPGSVTAQAAYFLEHAAARGGRRARLRLGGRRGARRGQGRLDQARPGVQPRRTGCSSTATATSGSTATTPPSPATACGSPTRTPPAGHPRVTHAWTVHQYGTSGGLDLDVGNFASEAALRAWAAKGGRPAAYEPFPGTAWFTIGRTLADRRGHARTAGRGRLRPLHEQLADKDVIGSGDVASYEAWQRKYNADHHKGWTGAQLKWPPGTETWNALHVPNV